jgi:hypothetical protein
MVMLLFVVRDFETGELFENQDVCFGAEGLIRAAAYANG